MHQVKRWFSFSAQDHSAAIFFFFCIWHEHCDCYDCVFLFVVFFPSFFCRRFMYEKHKSHGFSFGTIFSRQRFKSYSVWRMKNHVQVDFFVSRIAVFHLVISHCELHGESIFLWAICIDSKSFWSRSKHSSKFQSVIILMTLFQR